MSLKIRYRGVVKAFGEAHIGHHLQTAFQLVYRQKKDFFLVDNVVPTGLKITVALRNLDNPLLILRRIDITILQRHETSIVLFIGIVVKPWDYSLLVVLVAGINLSQIYSQKDKVLRQAFFQRLNYVLSIP